MKENYQAVSKALSDAGFKTSLESAAGIPLDFKFTPYSLNTKLSFRFDNFDDFIDFLSQTGTPDTPELRTSFLDLGLDPNNFFWVNFFEKGKEEFDMQ